MAKFEEHAKALNIKAVAGTAIISSFGFIIALFWRDAIKELIAKVVPEGEGMAYSFAAAIIVTIIAVIAIYAVSRWMNISIREHAKKLKSKAGSIDNRVIGRDITIRRRRKK